MTELNLASFKEAINSEQPVVVDFWADWCMPCRILSPVLEDISDELDGKANFCKLNTDDNVELAQEYDITAIPTVIVFKKGMELDRMVGVVPKQNIVSTISKYI